MTRMRMRALSAAILVLALWGVWRPGTAMAQGSGAGGKIPEAIALPDATGLPWPVKASEHVERGAALLEARLYPQAFAEFVEAVRLDGRNAEALAGRGMARLYSLESKSDLDAALLDLDAAIRIDPRCYTARLGRGVVRASKGQYDEAVADYDEAIRIDPRKADGLVLRGRAQVSRGEEQKALADYDEAIRIDPHSVNGHLYRGRIRLVRDEFEKAIADFDETIATEPACMWAYSWRGVAWLMKQDYEKALADLTEAVRIDPRDPHNHLIIALIRASCPITKLRDGKEAVKRAQIGIALPLAHGERGWSLSVLAAAYAEAGDFAKAVEVQIGANVSRGSSQGEELLRRYRDRRPYRIEGRESMIPEPQARG